MKRLVFCATLFLYPLIVLGQDVSESLAVQMANHYYQKIDLGSRKAFDSSDSLYRIHQLDTPERFSPNEKAGAGPDLPYLSESPAYQAGSNLGSLLYEIFH